MILPRVLTSDTETSTAMYIVGIRWWKENTMRWRDDPYIIQKHYRGRTYLIDNLRFLRSENLTKPRTHLMAGTGILHNSPEIVGYVNEGIAYGKKYLQTTINYTQHPHYGPTVLRLNEDAEALKAWYRSKEVPREFYTRTGQWAANEHLYMAREEVDPWW